MNNLHYVTVVFIAALVTFVGLFILVPILFGSARAFGLYTIVEERQCKVYMLFGKVVGVIDENIIGRGLR